MIFFLLLTIILSFFSSEPILFLSCCLPMVGIGKLFWKDGEPKIIFLGLLFFWLSISIKLFYAIYVGVEYEKLSDSPNIISTTYLAIIGFMVFSAGLFFTTKKIRSKIEINYSEFFGYDFRRVSYIFIASIFINIFLKGVFFSVAALAQIINALLQIKIGFLFFLIYFNLKKQSSYTTVIVLITIEIVLSLFSFFSSFKDILFTVALVLLGPKIKFNLIKGVGFGVFMIGTLYLLLLWQTIKGDYRTFLKQEDEQGQSINVSQSNALDKLKTLATETKNISENEEIIYGSIDRLSYIEFFSESTQIVPERIPYENGKLWTNNVAHILLPRIFFPDKGAIDDSEMVNKYCVRRVATFKEGASFSLGFIAESYIDFGPVGMFVPIFIIGCLFGYIYSLILKQSINYIWGYTLVTPLWFYINCNGTPGTKILGWLFMYYIAFYLFKRLLMKPLDNYLRTGSFTIKS